MGKNKELVDMQTRHLFVKENMQRMFHFFWKIKNIKEFMCLALTESGLDV